MLEEGREGRAEGGRDRVWRSCYFIIVELWDLCTIFTADLRQTLLRSGWSPFVLVPCWSASLLAVCHAAKSVRYPHSHVSCPSGGGGGLYRPFSSCAADPRDEIVVHNSIRLVAQLPPLPLLRVPRSQQIF